MRECARAQEKVQELFSSQQEPNRIWRIFRSITLLKELKEKELRIGPEKGPERDKSDRK